MSFYTGQIRLKIGCNIYIFTFTSHQGPHPYSSLETWDTSPATKVNVTSPRSFQSSILLTKCRIIRLLTMYHHKYVHLSTRNITWVIRAHILRVYELHLIAVCMEMFHQFRELIHNNDICSTRTCSHKHLHRRMYLFCANMITNMPNMIRVKRVKSLDLVAITHRSHGLYPNQ